MHARSLVYLSAWRRCFLSDLVKSCPSAAAFAVHSVMDDYDDMGDDETIFARPHSLAMQTLLARDPKIIDD